MKPKAKKVTKRKPAAPRRGSAKRASHIEGRGGKKEFAKVIWPRIKGSTKFVEVPEFQAAVTYRLRSGQLYTASLNWYGVSHGSKIFGHYDEENNVCYIGKFIE